MDRRLVDSRNPSPLSQLRPLLAWARAGGVLLDLERQQTDAWQGSSHPVRERQELRSFLAASEAETSCSWLNSLVRGGSRQPTAAIGAAAEVRNDKRTAWLLR